MQNFPLTVPILPNELGILPLCMYADVGRVRNFNYTHREFH